MNVMYGTNFTDRLLAGMHGPEKFLKGYLVRCPPAAASKVTIIVMFHYFLAKLPTNVRRIKVSIEFLKQFLDALYRICGAIQRKTLLSGINKKLQKASNGWGKKHYSEEKLARFIKWIPLEGSCASGWKIHHKRQYARGIKRI